MQITSEGLHGKSWLARQILLNEKLAVAVIIHGNQAMDDLGDFLPELYGAKSKMGGTDPTIEAE